MFEKNDSLGAIVWQIFKYAATLVVWVCILPFLLCNFNENMTSHNGTSWEDQLRVVHTDVRKERFIRCYSTTNTQICCYSNSMCTYTTLLIIYEADLTFL